jgi:C-terminal processing protease CtpA/Prc
VTISKFYRPDGASTQLKGVKADIVLPSLTEDSKLGEAENILADYVHACSHTASLN